MTDTFDQDSWERRWARVLEHDAAGVDRRPPNPRLTVVAAELAPGLALDAGAGHGAETLWLAARGWRVTAVDFAATALAHARSRAEGLGLVGHITWVQGDLGVWTPPAGRFDLVTSLHVHVAGSVPDMVARLAAGVAPGGTLLLAGHRPVDPATGAPTRAAGQTQVSVDEALSVLDPARWDVLVAEERPRDAAGDGVDAVVQARRRA
ncbi:class I SAM-dependent methyltransferase [Actinomycetospora sp. C-140]